MTIATENKVESHNHWMIEWKKLNIKEYIMVDNLVYMKFKTGKLMISEIKTVATFAG